MTHPYPQSIEEAAKLFDKISPEWEKKINIDRLDMKNGTLCILGQIYGFYSHGMHLLFFLDASSYEKYNQDRILGINTDCKKWIVEINKRLNPSVKQDFAWALKQIADGKKVIHPTLSGQIYLLEDSFGHLVDSNGCTNIGINYLNDWIIDNRWSIYEPEIMLKVGDKLKNGQSTYIVANVDIQCYSLINIDKGTRWSSPIKITDERITLERLVGASYQNMLKDFVVIK